MFNRVVAIKSRLYKIPMNVHFYFYMPMIYPFVARHPNARGTALLIKSNFTLENY